MRVLNSSGLVVDFEEATPITSGPWGAPHWMGSSLEPPRVSPALPNSVFCKSGGGWFDLDTRVIGTRGTLSVTLVAGASGLARGLVVLTPSMRLLTPSLTLALDGLNRPILQIRNALGTLVASTMASFEEIHEGDSLTIVASWDSSQAISGARLARLLVRGGDIPSRDWMVNPVASWTPFMPTFAGLGFGIGPTAPFNGQILSAQISNDVYAGSGEVWSYRDAGSLFGSSVDSVALMDSVDRAIT